MSTAALVNPELLIWARETRGFGIDEAAKKLSTSEKRLSSWEAGEVKPTLRQLYLLADVYKRPMTLFYLAQSPPKPTALPDFRRFPGTESNEPTPELLLEIRKANRRRKDALELAEDALDVPFISSAKLSESPEQVALRVREKLAVSIGEQIGWSDSYEALNKWRVAVENHGVLVFQSYKVALHDMRGIAICEKKFPVIVLNSADSPNGRIFTLMHELGHLYLGESGISGGDYNLTLSRRRSVEAYCNRLAASVLLPSEVLLSDPLVKQLKGRKITDTELTNLSRKYKASRLATLIRLVTLGRQSMAFYKERNTELAEVKPKRSNTGGPAYSMQVVKRNGIPFTRMVLEAFHKDKISLKDVGHCLEMRLKHLDKVEDLIR